MDKQRSAAAEHLPAHAPESPIVIDPARREAITTWVRDATRDDPMVRQFVAQTGGKSTLFDVLTPVYLRACIALLTGTDGTTPTGDGAAGP